MRGKFLFPLIRTDEDRAIFAGLKKSDRNKEVVLVKSGEETNPDIRVDNEAQADGTGGDRRRPGCRSF